MAEVQLEGADIVEERLVALRLRGLARKRADLALVLGNDVADADEVGLGVVELAQGFLLLGLVFRDPGGLLEDGTAVLGFRTEEHVDLALLHDRVARAPDPGAHEEVLDVLEAAGLFVDEILALAVAEDPAAEGDLVVIRLENAGASRERQRPSAIPRGERLSVPLKMTSDISPPEGLRRGFPEHPAHRVDDVRLAASIRTDDAGDSSWNSSLVLSAKDLNPWISSDFRRMTAGQVGGVLLSKSRNQFSQMINQAYIEPKFPTVEKNFPAATPNFAAKLLESPLIFAQSCEFLKLEPKMRDFA